MENIMKTWIDKLRKIPTERLIKMINAERKQIELKERDISTILRVLSERKSGM